MNKKKTNILLYDLVTKVKEMVGRDNIQVAQSTDTLFGKVYFAVSFSKNLISHTNHN